MRVLGIDPGTLHLGWGLVDDGDGVLRHRRHGVFHAGADRPLAGRLVTLRRALVGLIAAERPDAVAVEGLFYARNVQSALKLAHARGVVLLTAAEHSLEIVEYSPMEVKRSVVGQGRATKDQVAGMVRRLLALPEPPRADAGDALAVAICHLHTRRLAWMRQRRGPRS